MLSPSVRAGLVGGIMGFILSTLMNYFIFPLPNAILASALGNGLSGLLSGFMGGFMGLLIYLKQQKKLLKERCNNVKSIVY